MIDGKKASSSQTKKPRTSKAAHKLEVNRVSGIQVSYKYNVFALIVFILRSFCELIQKLRPKMRRGKAKRASLPTSQI